MKELKKVMIEQLDVFLSVETKPFVERLFDAISSEEYFTTPAIVPTSTETTEAPTVPKADDEQLNIIETPTTTNTPSTSAYIKKEETPPLEEVMLVIISQYSKQKFIFPLNLYFRAQPKKQT